MQNRTRGGRLVREMVGERNTVHNKWQSGGKESGWKRNLLNYLAFRAFAYGGV